MTWTYASSAPDFSTTLAQIRFLVGDTDTTDQQVSDEEIAYCQTRSGSNTNLAAAYACDAIAAKYARLVTTSVGDLSVTYSDLQKHYQSLSAQLKGFGAAGAICLGGGISQARVTEVNDDTDRVEPAFFVGMLDSPEATRLSVDEVEDEG
jgi:hypothetical protein